MPDRLEINGKIIIDLPGHLQVRVDQFLTANELYASQLFHAIIPIGAFGLWVDRAVEAERQVKELTGKTAQERTAGMQQTILHTASDPAGTPIGDLPTAAPTPAAPPEARYADGRLVQPGPPIPEPQPLDAGQPSLLMQEALRRQADRANE